MTVQNLTEPQEIAGPVGFHFIETAPRDGTFVRLRFRPGIGREDREEIGQWQPHTEMKSGGAWFRQDGSYITPGPLYFALAGRAALKEEEK